MPKKSEGLTQITMARTLMTAKDVGTADYVFSEEEKRVLERFVGLMMSPKLRKKYPTMSAVAGVLGVPAPRLQMWRRTPEYLDLLRKQVQVESLERVGMALPAQSKLSRKVSLPGSTQAFTALASVSARMREQAPAKGYERKLKDLPQEGAKTVNVEQLIINIARERLGMPVVDAEVVSEADKGTDKAG